MNSLASHNVASLHRPAVEINRVALALAVAMELPEITGDLASSCGASEAQERKVLCAPLLQRDQRREVVANREEAVTVPIGRTSHALEADQGGATFQHVNRLVIHERTFDH